MDITVPDTVHGAVLLSIIDFFLSFIVISFIGFVLAAFPLMNRIGPGLAARIQQPPPSPAASLPDEVDMTAEDHIAVISAAVAAMVGAHRIVRIERARHGPGWLAEGRAAQHGSHAHPGSHAAPPPQRPA